MTIQKYVMVSKDRKLNANGWSVPLIANMLKIRRQDVNSWSAKLFPHKSLTDIPTKKTSFLYRYIAALHFFFCFLGGSPFWEMRNEKTCRQLLLILRANQRVWDGVKRLCIHFSASLCVYSCTFLMNLYKQFY